LMVGSFYYMRHESDWCYTSAYDYFYQRNLRKIADKQDFNLEKNAYLIDYIKFFESRAKAQGLTKAKHLVNEKEESLDKN
jgi:hypothetical protein